MQQVKLLSADERLLFALSGEIDSATSEDFYAEVYAAYTHDKKDIVFDCSGVKLYKMVKADGNGFKLTKVCPRIKKLFEICALDKLMEIES